MSLSDLVNQYAQRLQGHEDNQMSDVTGETPDHQATSLRQQQFIAVETERIYNELLRHYQEDRAARSVTPRTLSNPWGRPITIPTMVQPRRLDIDPLESLVEHRSTGTHRTRVTSFSRDQAKKVADLLRKHGWTQVNASALTTLLIDEFT